MTSDSTLTCECRICPGRYLAMNTVFIAVASILWAMKLEKPLDESGKEVTLDDTEEAFFDGLLWYVTARH